MEWILFKRAVRDLKAGWARYLALSILIVFSLFIVISLMGASVTVLDSTDVNNKKLSREDGEFSVFVPLRDDEIKKLNDKGVTLEKMFYADYEVSGNKVLRAFKVRENINKVGLIEGRMPEADDEAVIERRYSEENKVKVGSSIKIGEYEFTVTGIGAAPDYNNMVKKISDSVVDSKSFGLIFVTSDAYDRLYASGASLSSEEYYYAYLLGSQMSEEELKNTLEDIEFKISDTNDKYFKEYWDRMTGKKDDLLEAIDKLNDGAKELADGAKELSDGTKEFHNGMGELKDSVPDLKKGIKSLDDGAAKFEKGIKDYTNGIGKVATGASSLSKGAKTLAKGTKQLNSGAKQFGKGMDEYAGAVNSMTRSENPYVAGVAKEMDGSTKQLAGGYAQIKGGVSGVNSGAVALSSGASKMYDGIKKLNSSHITS